MSPSLFWDLSIDEINDLIESYRRKYEIEAKQTLIFNKIQAEQIMHEILPLLAEKLPDDYRKPQLWDYYPDLFINEKEMFEKKQEEDKFEEFKEGRRRFAEQLRKKRGGSS